MNCSRNSKHDRQRRCSSRISPNPHQDLRHHVGGNGARLEQSKKATQSNPEQERLGQIRAEVNRLAAANDLPAAAATYRNLLRAAPDTVFGEQRQLELANQLYANHDHAHAAAAYELLLDRYPAHDKAPDAMLKLGLTQYGMEQQSAAEATLAAVSQRYPGSDAARTADDRLRAIQLGSLR